MHEHTFIQSIIKDVDNKEEVVGISIELGELVGIEANHLKEHLYDETGWSVDVKNVPGKVKCSCGYEGKPEIKERLHDMVIYECPNCSSFGPEIIEGGEIVIVKVIYR